MHLLHGWWFVWRMEHNLVLRCGQCSLWPAETELAGVSTSLCVTHCYSTKSYLVIQAPQLSTPNLSAQILTSAGSASISNQPTSTVSATATSGISKKTNLAWCTPFLGCYRNKQQHNLRLTPGHQDLLSQSSSIIHLKHHETLHSLYQRISCSYLFLARKKTEHCYYFIFFCQEANKCRLNYKPGLLEATCKYLKETPARKINRCALFSAACI